MTELEYFILGILFSQVASPLLESLNSLISAGLEVIKSKMAVTMAKYNYEIQKISKKDEEASHCQVGFVVDAGEEKE